MNLIFIASANVTFVGWLKWKMGVNTVSGRYTCTFAMNE